MIFRPIISAAILLLLAGACLPACSKHNPPAQAKQNQSTPPQNAEAHRFKPIKLPDASALVGKPGTIAGTVLTVNDNGILTVRPLNDSSAAPSKTILLAGNATVTIDSYPAALKDIRRGMHVCFRESPNDAPLTRLEVYSLLPDQQPHTQSGAVDAVEGNELIVNAGSHGSFPCPAIITPATIITIDGKPATPPELKHGMPVKVDYLNYTAKNIAAFTTITDGESHRIRGNLEAVQKDELVLRIKGKSGYDVTLKVPPDAKILIGSTHATLADLHRNQSLTVTYQNDIISEIAAKGNHKPSTIDTLTP